ncbi:uncharacterized protein [Clytia hemisphaerica]|uniref:RRM domain-containing protein n=1 Tax=Clytia hemisphaerica TaxID=252671 RepID=A0A7M5XC71_9CNID
MASDATTLFIGRLGPGVTDKDLSNIFDKYGRTVSTTIIDGKGFGFVQFETSTEANDAINGANGAEVKGSQISVEMARDKQSSSFSGGFRGRGRGMRRGSDDGGYRGRGFSSRGGGYSRGGYGRSREYDSDRSHGGRDSYEPRGRGRARGGPRGAPRFGGGDRYSTEDRYGGGERSERRHSDRFERYEGGSRYEERYQEEEDGLDDRYSRGGERRERREWHEEEYEEPRERRSSFGRGGSSRGSYTPRGRGDFRSSDRGRSERGSSRGGFARGGSFSRGSGDRGGFSRRGGGDRGGYSSGYDRHERAPRESNRDWYGASERRSGGEDRHGSGERFQRHRDEDGGGYRGRGAGRGGFTPRGRGRGRGGFSSRGGSLGGGRSFSEDY